MNTGLKMNSAPAAFFPGRRCAGRCIHWEMRESSAEVVFVAALNTPIGEEN